MNADATKTTGDRQLNGGMFFIEKNSFEFEAFARTHTDESEIMSWICEFTGIVKKSRFTITFTKH